MKSVKTLLGLTLLIVLSSCGSAIDKFNSSPHRISVNRGDSLFDNYHDRFDATITTMQEEFKTREVEYLPTEYLWVSKNDLQCYLDMLEEVEKLNDREISGVAIYLGAYGADQVARNNKQRKSTSRSLNDALDDLRNGRFISTRSIDSKGDYDGRITTFLAPTFYDKTDTTTYSNELPRHKPFYIQPYDNSNKYKGVYHPLDFRAITAANGSRSIVDTTSLLMNELNAMPPKKPGNQ